MNNVPPSAAGFDKFPPQERNRVVPALCCGSCPLGSPRPVTCNQLCSDDVNPVPSYWKNETRKIATQTRPIGEARSPSNELRPYLLPNTLVVETAKPQKWKLYLIE